MHPSRLYYKKTVLKKNVAEKNFCMNLFPNKVAGLPSGTFFEKGSCTLVFL